AWCTAAGDDANNGLTPATPKATVQAILADYDLEPGDTVRIDTGTYNLKDNINVSSADGGSAAAPVIFEASPYGVTFSHDSIWAGVCWFLGADHVVVRTALSTKYSSRPQSWMLITGADVGIAVGGNHTEILRCDVAGNRTSGIIVYSDHVAIRHCLARDTINEEQGSGIRLWAANYVSISNCSVVGNGKYGIDMNNSAGSTLNSSIVSVDGPGRLGICIFRQALAACDFNNLYATGGALVGALVDFSVVDSVTLADWQVATGLDAHSISVDPLFVDPANGDFHLQSTAGSYHGGLWTADAVDSPCLDAGDPATGVGDEPAPNGQRINLGAYGGTEQASKSHVRRSIQLTSPMPGTLLKSSAAISWFVFGDAWQPGDTVSIEWSADGGATWHPVTGGAGLDADTGVFSWSLFGFEWGDSYRVRLTCDQDAASTFCSADFSVGGMYYVNDDSLEGDVYCSATGDDDANHGRSAASPKASLQVLLESYDLEPGDVVYVESGTYLLEDAVTIDASDGGAPEKPVTIRGPNPPGHVVFSCANADTDVFVLRASDLNLQRLRLLGGRAGISVTKSGFRFRITECILEGQAAFGVYVEEAGGTLENNIIIGAPYGVLSLLQANVTLVGNTLWQNQYSVTLNGYTTSTPRVQLRHNILSPVNGGRCFFILRAGA
ncbi:MAG: hypothetical protein GX617_16145, partial [Lentisphaerae bacterium]|nr:hypothetical protein [Lentisphaerota bacterium]